ncbi:MAG TPA: hypothetical protein VKE22_30445 [Haliangiales bacterium]|nr:hypothetical protein [Haliangiales bacterium]
MDAPPPPSIACIWPASAPAGRDDLDLDVHGVNFLPGAVVRWNGADRPTRTVDSGHLQATIPAADLTAPANASVTVANPPPGGASDAGATFAVVSIASRHRIPDRALVVGFERRGYPSEYWNGQVVQDWNVFDPVVGSTRANEVALELDKMREMGVNVLRFEIRSSDPTDGPFVPPTCLLGPPLGFQYPQPTAQEMTNFRAFLDLAQAKGFKVWLELVNLHMEEQPPTNNQTWLGAILAVAKGHPSIDLVLFDGDIHVHTEVTPNTCGIPAEAPLYLGPTSTAAQYVKWAIGFAMSLGMPARQLSAEGITGAYILDQQQPAGSNATDGHLWQTVPVMKSIFDELGVQPEQRTYALSLYEERRCQRAGRLPCVDEPPEPWTDEMLRKVWATVGRCSGARVVLPETGALPPVGPAWPSQRALESLTTLMERHGVEGSAYWRWVATDTTTEADTTQGTPVKLRGTAFTYTAVQKEVLDQGGLHVGLVPNGSFERGPAGGGAPDLWTLSASATGSGARYLLTGEPGQPEVPSRGSYALRLRSGSDPSGAALATSGPIPIDPSARYTLVGNLRFRWSGDPNPSAPADARPQVRVAIRYFDVSGAPSAARAADFFRFFQEDGTQGFATFPLAFAPPADASAIRVELAVLRNGLPAELVADFDNLR